MTDILKLFEGLDKNQAMELRKQIVPTLEKLRSAIVNKSKTKKPSSKKTTRGKHDAMLSNNNKR